MCTPLMNPSFGHMWTFEYVDYEIEFRKVNNKLSAEGSIKDNEKKKSYLPKVG